IAGSVAFNSLAERKSNRPEGAFGNYSVRFARARYRPSGRLVGKISSRNTGPGFSCTTRQVADRESRGLVLPRQNILAIGPHVYLSAMADRCYESDWLFVVDRCSRLWRDDLFRSALFRPKH